MLNLFGCLGVLVLGVFLLAAALIGIVWRFLLSVLGLRKPTTHQQQAADASRQAEASSTTHTNASSADGQANSKIFKPDESEYVEFEEYREHP